MGLDNIRQTVLESARTEAARIVEAAERESAAEVAAAKERVRADAEREYAAKERAISEDFARKLIQFKGGASKQLVDKRNVRLQGIFDRARAEISGWSAEAYGDLLPRLIARASGDVGGQLRVHPKDRALFEGALAKVNAKRSPAQQVTLDGATPLDTRGGFVFVTQNFEVDQTLDTILADIEHELTPEIAAKLFAD